MNRGIITISEGGLVSIPTAPIWMTMQEIADMLDVFGHYKIFCVNGKIQD